MSRDENVIVVGAGMSGLALAHELINQSLRLQILKTAERVAEGWRGRHPQLGLDTHTMCRALSS